MRTKSCVDCGCGFSASIYSRSTRCVDCQKTHERLADNAAHREKRAARQLPTEYPCKECGETVFWSNKLGRRPTLCLDCQANFSVIYEQKYRCQRQPRDEAMRLKYRLKASYRITPEIYQEMKDRQNGKCFGCQLGEDEVGTFHIDHDHSCCPGDRSCGNCLRGLLCRACNTALGLLAEDPDRLRAARIYLRKWARTK